MLTNIAAKQYYISLVNILSLPSGNLTKHMKSKAHSKKCVDLGVSVGLLEEQDTEESGKAFEPIFHQCYCLCIYTLLSVLAHAA